MNLFGWENNSREDISGKISSIYVDWMFSRKKTEDDEGYDFHFWLYPSLEIEHTSNDILKSERRNIEYKFLGATIIRLSWIFLSITLTIRNT